MSANTHRKFGIAVAGLVLLAACSSCDTGGERGADVAEYFGTLEPFAAEAVYFIVTDRFVDGDADNNHEDQGREELGSFDRPVQLPGLPPGNIGYLGGDFRGVLQNAAYIADMGFSAVWLTPIVDNPDEAFTGGTPPGEGGSNDQGKTGYHGYWGVNFFEVDEHLESPDLSYADLTRQLQQEHGLKTILDVVANHGSPSFSMPEDQPKYGEIYNADGELVADHQNLYPSELDENNPLHAFFRRERDLAELSDMDYENPDVLDYFVAAYSKWIGQGAAALRIDTIKHMPHAFWKKFADRIRALHPDTFLFAEAWAYEADVIAEFTYPENGGISVLDFPGQKLMAQVFGKTGGRYADLADYLHLYTGLYQNPYDLMTFYDNHDMPRIDAEETGFINANNWLFTSRGIPVVYYGSETGFRAGRDQHSGNRDYFGQDNIELAKQHPVHAALRRIANVRRMSVALQRGLQANLRLSADTAVFFRVYQKDGEHQTALVLLNKGDDEADIHVTKWLTAGAWRDAMTGEEIVVNADQSQLSVTVDAHGVRVLLLDAPVDNLAFEAELDRLQQQRLRSEVTVEMTSNPHAPKDYVQITHPDWSSDAAIYQINTRQFTPEGTFAAAEKHLPRLKELGVEILWLMPIHPIGEENRKGSLGSPYAVKDYFGVNPEFGTFEDFRRFVDAAHAQGMYVILDWVANHTAWDNAMRYEHPEWYERDYKGDFRPTPWWDWSDIIDLDYSQPAVRKYMTEALKYWVREADIDGYRCDVAGFVPVDFWNNVRRELDAIKPVFMLAEWESRDLHASAFDMTYAWSWHEAVRAVVQGHGDLGKLFVYYSWNESAYPREAYRMTYVSNHDANAWDATQFEAFGDGLEAAIVLSVVGEGLPLIYNGQEAGNPKRLKFFEKDPIDWQEHRIGELYTSLLALKKSTTALWNGQFGARMIRVWNSVPGTVFSFVRADDQSRVFAVINFSPDAQTVQFSESLHHGRYQDYFAASEIVLDSDSEVRLGPWEYKVYVD